MSTTTRTKYAYQREDGTFVGHGGRGRMTLDTTVLRVKQYDFSGRNRYAAMEFYVAPGEDVSKWKNIRVEETVTRKVVD